MKMHGIPANLCDPIQAQHQGIVHLVFEVEHMDFVDKKEPQLQTDRFEILIGPRKTGDGSYEFETSDPDRNQLEVSALYM